MLEGKFSNAQVDEVLGTVVQGAGTGRLSLQGTSLFGGAVRGTFYIESGRLVHIGDISETAHTPIVDLFCLREGSFTFASGETSQIKDQTLPISELVLQVTAAQDEWNAVRQQVGSMDAVFALKADGAAADVTLAVAQWEVLIRLDGKASLRQIAQGLGISSVAVARVAADLLQRGLIDEHQGSAVAVPELAERPERRGFFDLRRRR